jgi:hypothetical protein
VVTGVQTCALPICITSSAAERAYICPIARGGFHKIKVSGF